MESAEHNITNKNIELQSLSKNFDKKICSEYIFNFLMTYKKGKFQAKQPVKQPKGYNYGLPLATKGLTEKSGCF